MIVLPRSAIARLCQRGMVEVWSPRESRPASNVIHVVRARHNGETVTRARSLRNELGHVLLPREAVLQDLTYQEALTAGFKTRDEFYGWWRKRYATGPLMLEPVLCWVMSYERVDVDIPQFLSAGGGYTGDGHRSVDVEWHEGHRVPVEAVTDERYLKSWAERAEEQRKARWKLERRGGKEAA